MWEKWETMALLEYPVIKGSLGIREKWVKWDYREQQDPWLRDQMVSLVKTVHKENWDRRDYKECKEKLGRRGRKVIKELMD